MRIFRHFDTVPERSRGVVLALGSFDGFHRGHQAIIARAGIVAREMGVALAVMTTEPHPRLYFKPDHPPFLLTPFRAKAHHLERFGVDILHVLPFDRRLASMPAQNFLLDVVIKGLGALHVVAGYDYRFGQGRGGSSSLLAWMGEMEGLGVTIHEPVGIGIEGSAGEIYSSTLIRNALVAGEARRAAALLGHWWSIEGHVIAGHKRGREIGFATANIAMGEYLRPKLGVYAIRAHIPGQAAPIDGVANIGKRPTFGQEEVVLEAHLFDFDGDLYGQTLSVDLVAFIRAEQKFDGLAALKAQIARDCHTARLLLNDPENATDHFPPPKLEDWL